MQGYNKFVQVRAISTRFFFYRDGSVPFGVSGRSGRVPTGRPHRTRGERARAWRSARAPGAGPQRGRWNERRAAGGGVYCARGLGRLRLRLRVGRVALVRGQRVVARRVGPGVVAQHRQHGRQLGHVGAHVGRDLPDPLVERVAVHRPHHLVRRPLHAVGT